MTTHVTTAPRHTHQCSECGRPFYLCSERDCDMAPDTCRACELDRQDDYMDRLEATHTSPLVKVQWPTATPETAQQYRQAIVALIDSYKEKN